MRLPLFPLRTVLFPGMLLPLHIFEPRYRDMINTCLAEGQPFGVVLIRSGPEVGAPAEPHPVGTLAAISRVERLPDGRMNIEVLGQERFRILGLHHDQAYLTGTVETFPLQAEDATRARRSAQALRPWIERYVALIGEAASAPIQSQHLPDDPTALAYLAAIVAQIPYEEKQALLMVATVAELLERERTIYRREVSLVRNMLEARPASSDTSFSLN